MSVQRPPRDRRALALRPGHVDQQGPCSLSLSPSRSWRADWLGLLHYVLVISPLLSAQHGPQYFVPFVRQAAEEQGGLVWPSLS